MRIPVAKLCSLVCQRLFRSQLSANSFFSLQNEFPDSIVNFKDDIISATLDVYNTAASSLLPTPTKSHYLFNLRDVSRVVGGLVMMQRDAVTDIKGPKVKYVRLWVHEVLRVFYDRCAAHSVHHCPRPVC